MDFKFNFKTVEKYTPKTGDIFLEKCYGYITGFFIRLAELQAVSIVGEIPQGKFAALNLQSNKIKLLSEDPRQRYFEKLKVVENEIQN